MRVLNSLSIEYVDDTLRVHKGTTAWAVFVRVSEGPGRRDPGRGGLTAMGPDGATVL